AGYLPAEAVGTVLLMPLSLARRRGCRVHGVLLGGSERHGGRTSGYGVPDPAVEAGVLRDALEDAGVAPDRVGYIELAANGSPLGDAAEIEALLKVFRTVTTPVFLGSAK